VLLAIEAGNSAVKFGLYEEGWLGTWAAASRVRALDEWMIMVESWMGNAGRRMSELKATAISSVVPSLTGGLLDFARELGTTPPLVARHDSFTSLRILYEPASDLGIDRLLGAVAARQIHGVPVIVVDLGTATTVTVVDGDNAVIGGAIGSGLGIGAEALVATGARLSEVRLEVESGLLPIGTTTEASVRSGTLLGHASLVEGLVGRARRELGSNAPVVATGGYSGLLGSMLPCVDDVRPGLTLDGLRLCWEQSHAIAG
jgi:type III pantothenate kinase